MDERRSVKRSDDNPTTANLRKADQRKFWREEFPYIVALTCAVAGLLWQIYPLIAMAVAYGLWMVLYERIWKR